MLIFCDFFPLPFQNSLIYCFLFSFFRNKNKLGYNVSWFLFHHGRCWIYKIVLQNCTNVLEEWDPRKHLLSLYILSWRLSAMLWCVRKCLQSATMLSYSSWGKRGIYTPIAQWLSCICWIEYWKKKLVISTVTADQLYAVVIQTVDVKLNPIRRKLECNRSVNVNSSHLFSDWYVNFLSGHSRIWWTSGFNSHLWKRTKLFTACFLGSDVQNYFPLNRWFDLLFFFFIWCWAVAIKTFAGAVGFCFFLSSNYTELLLAEHGLAKRTSTDYDVKGFSNIFFGLRFFLLIFLVGRGNSLLCISISKAPAS